MRISEKAARKLYRANDHRASPVQIEPRPRGGSSIRGGGRVAAGRNIHCRICRDEAYARYDAGETTTRPGAPLWYTNLSGLDGQSWAEEEAGKHLLTHRGEIPLRVPLPAKYALDWVAQQDARDAGAVLIDETARQVILELPQGALDALLVDLQHATGTGRVDAEAAHSAAAQRCLTALTDLGLAERALAADAEVEAGAAEPIQDLAQAHGIAEGAQQAAAIPYGAARFSEGYRAAKRHHGDEQALLARTAAAWKDPQQDRGRDAIRQVWPALAQALDEIEQAATTGRE